MAISLLLLTSSGQEQKFHIVVYWHLVVKNGNFYISYKNDNFTLLLTSSGQEWQFHIATDI